MYFSTSSVTSITQELEGRLNGSVRVATPVTTPIKKMSNDLFVDAQKRLKTKKVYNRPNRAARVEKALIQSEAVLQEAKAYTAQIKAQTKRVQELTRQSQSAWRV